MRSTDLNMEEQGFYFFSLLRNFKTDIANATEVENKLYIYTVSDFNQLHPQLQNPIVIRSIGEVIFRRLIRNSILFNAYNDLGAMSADQVMLIIDEQASAFTSCLWFVKDCSCDVDFSIYVDSSSNRCRLINNNSPCTNVEGFRIDTHFSQAELTIAKEYAIKYARVQTSAELLIPDEIKNDTLSETPRLNYIDYNKLNRVERAYYFLNAARKDTFVPSKIATLVILFEALFANVNDTGEITYKISHRVAAFLSNDRGQRKATFSLVSKFYGFRSKFLHGQALPTATKKVSYTREQINEISCQIDDLVRKIFRKVLDDPKPFLEKDATEFQTWLTGLYYS